MKLLLRLCISTVAVFIAAYILPGVEVRSIGVAVLVAIVLGIVNTIVKPILVILTLPVTIVTIGLFLLVINVAMIELTDSLVSGFTVNGFWWALLFSVAVSIVSSFLYGLSGEKR